MNQRVTGLAGTAIAAAIWFVLLWGAWLAFVDTNNLQVLASEMRGPDGKPKTQFKRGDTLHVYRRMCVSKVSPGVAVIEVRSADKQVVHPLYQRVTGQVSGCVDRTVSTPLPPTIPPGKYQLVAYVAYSINPLRDAHYTLPPIDFEIVN